MSETALGEGLKRWSIETGSAAYTAACEAYRKAEGDEAKFYKAFWEKLAADGDARVAALRPYFVRAQEDMQGSPGAGFSLGAEKAGVRLPTSGDAADGMPGGGLVAGAGKASSELPPTRQQNGDAAGNGNLAGEGFSCDSRPPPDSREAGAKLAAPEGSRTPSPAREPSDSTRKGILAGHKSSAAAVNRSLGWLGDMRLPGGRHLTDITVGEIDSYIAATRRSAFDKVMGATDDNHQAVVLCKIKQEVDKAGVAPPNARPLEILSQEVIDRIVRDWSHDKITRETVKRLTSMNEQAVEMLLERANG